MGAISSFITAGKQLYHFGDDLSKATEHLMSNETIAKVDPRSLIKEMSKTARESKKALNRYRNSPSSLLVADSEQWGEGKLKKLGIKDRSEAKNLGIGRKFQAAFLNNNGTLSKANIAGAYIGANAVINGHMGIPIISDSDREFTGGTTSALIGGGAFALAKKFL